MYRIQKEVIDEFVINKSRFITYLQRVNDEESAKSYITSIKKLHPKATHHCQAVLIDDNLQRSSDDGEPAGTAGIPMLEVLRKRQMELIVAVVVRYYGGIQLGAGGLIRAYSKGVSDALNKADIYQVLMMEKHTIQVDYQYADQIEHYLSNFDILNKDYAMQVSFSILTKDDSFKENVLEISRGSATINSSGMVEVEVKVKEEKTND